MAKDKPNGAADGHTVQAKMVIFLYNRLFDPIVQATFWHYITPILAATQPNLQLHVISYEHPTNPMTTTQRESLMRWQAQGLGWTALRWHPGTGLRPKLTDLLNGIVALGRLRTQGYTHCIAFCSIAGCYAYLASALFRYKLMLYSYEPHSEYAVDNHMWSRGLMFKIVNRLEHASAHFANVIISGTAAMEHRLKNEWRVSAEYYKIPCVVDDKKFHYSPDAGLNTKRKLGIPETAYVLLYAGKFGGLYYGIELFQLYKRLCVNEPDLHLLIVTPQDRDEIARMAVEAGLAGDSLTITSSTYNAIETFYFAGDIGIVSVPPGPSKCFISNIKVGEYLCSGLPFIICEGVSEDYLVARNSNVGIVLPAFSEEADAALLDGVRQFRSEVASGLRQRCRAIGVEYRGTHRLTPLFNDACVSFID